MWVNPSGTIVLSDEIETQYSKTYQDLQAQWYRVFPEANTHPYWYVLPNPLLAANYPPGFLKNSLDVATIYTASSPDTDGYYWANSRVYKDIESYEKLNNILTYLTNPVDMVIISGEEMDLEEACGVCWREYGTVGFDIKMPIETAHLLENSISDRGLLVMGSCRAGDYQELVQQMANVVGRPVAGAKGVCRGVRSELLFEHEVPWTLGGYAEGGSYTLAFPNY
jgi:hypothetical protein